LSADLGTITAGTVTGGIIRTAASGARVELDGLNATKQIAAYNSGGDQTFQVKDDGSGFWGILVSGVRPIVVSAAGAVSVNTEGLAANAATVPSSAYTAGYIAVDNGSFKTMQSVAVTAIGASFLISGNISFQEQNVSDSTAQIRILRGATDLGTIGDVTLIRNTLVGCSGIIMDTPAAGSYTYYLQAQVTTDYVTGGKRSLNVIQFKR
jgi:hypothetical protein